MGEINKHTIINAPAEAVFRDVVDPHNAPSYISSRNSIVSGPTGAPSQGQAWTAEASFLGRRTTITLRLAQMRPNSLVRFAITGEPAATLSLERSPHGGDNQSNVSLLMDVPSVPTLFLSALMSGLLTEDLARLKMILES